MKYCNFRKQAIYCEVSQKFLRLLLMPSKRKFIFGLVKQGKYKLFGIGKSINKMIFL